MSTVMCSIKTSSLTRWRSTMPSPSDVLEGFKGLGFRTPPEAMSSLLAQLTKTKASPAQVCEQLLTLERRERDAKNLKSRTQAATLGSFKTLDHFDWNHPTSIDRALFEQLHGLDFVQAAQNVL